jgi:D12 class N6 adenine-specific DNA methyltransferase
MDGNVSEWLGAVDGLPEIHHRLRHVRVENMPALDFIQREDTTNTLFYCDPPYLHEARTARKVYGQFEMTEADHQQLLAVLCHCKGKVMRGFFFSVPPARRPNDLNAVPLLDQKLHQRTSVIRRFFFAPEAWLGISTVCRFQFDSA